jgi:hypothetical protein
MSLNDFSSYLDLPVSDAVRQVFNMYDRVSNFNSKIRIFLNLYKIKYLGQ